VTDTNSGRAKYGAGKEAEMKIVAKIDREDRDLAERMRGKGLEARVIRGRTLIELNKTGNVYDIPVEVKSQNPTLMIDCSECGGGMTNTGNSTIVCGLSGKKLRPYYVPRGGHLANGNHAYFAVPSMVVTISGYRQDYVVTIEEHAIIVNGSRAHIKSSIIWSDEVDNLPNYLDRYREAAYAAYEKSNCYHCRCVHYAEPKRN